MTNQINVNVFAGSMVFWKAGMSPLAKLHEATEALGVSVYWYPINDNKALELALGDYFERKGKLIRPSLPADGCPGAVVVSEKQQSNKNDYESDRKYYLDPETYEVFYYENDVRQNADYINAQVYKGMVSGARVGFGMEAVMRTVGGYKLRDGARIYFIPQQNMAAWERVEKTFSDLIGAQFFRVNCPVDADTAAAVADNAAVELRQKYQSIIDAIFETESKLGGDISERVRETAERKRNALLAELESVKREAQIVDDSFKGLLTLADEIGNEIDSAMAMAILTTVD